MTSDANTSGAAGEPEATALPGTREVEPGSVHVLLGRSRTRVVMTGEIDAELGPDLLEAAAEAEDADRPVEVDAQHVSFMDSTGVAFLARLASRTAQPLLLIRPPEVVRFLVDVTSVNELVTIVDDDPGFDPTPPDGGYLDDDPDGPPDLAG